MGDTARPTPVQVIVARGTFDVAAALEMAAATDRCIVVAGLVPITYRTAGRRQRWQFSLSHWGRPAVIVSVHWYKRDAEMQVSRVYAVSVNRDLCDGATFATLIEELATFGDRDEGAAEV